MKSKLKVRKDSKGFLLKEGCLKRKLHLVNQSTICINRSQGLGIISLSILTKALLYK